MSLPTLEQRLALIAPYLPSGIEAFLDNDRDPDGPSHWLAVARPVMRQVGEDEYEADVDVMAIDCPEPDDVEEAVELLFHVIRAYADALARAQEREAVLRRALFSVGQAHERGEIIASGTPGFMALMSARAALAAAEVGGVEGGA